MNVWLVTIGEPLPIDDGSPRLLRAGLLATYLAASGESVTWWSSTFDHQKKRLRAPALSKSVTSDGVQLILLHGRPYSSNVSFSRIRNHGEIAKQFSTVAPTTPKPDVILASYPTPELCEEAVRYGKRNGVPVILDIRDLWPDMFLDFVPRQLRPLARLGLEPLFRQSRRVCREATAIFGVTDAFRDWGIERGQRERNKWDATFPMAYPEQPPTATAISAAETSWDQHGVSRDRPIVCFFGTFGRQFDLDTVINAARIARRAEPALLWVLCGDGEQLARYRRLASDLENVVFPGWVDRAAIYTLMRRAKAGLAPYLNTENFVLNFPNKPIEYLSAGLPVIATLEGVFKEKIVNGGAGISVVPGDPVSLLNALLTLVRDSERHTGMADAARRLYEAEYVAEIVYGKMIEHLRWISKTVGA